MTVIVRKQTIRPNMSCETEPCKSKQGEKLGVSLRCCGGCGRMQTLHLWVKEDGDTHEE